MSKFDVESFRDYWLDLIKLNLAAKISEICAEKADGLQLEIFTDEQWTNDLNNVVMNFDSFVLYTLNIVNPTTHGQDFSRDVSLTIEIVFANQEGGAVVESSILRYMRAIFEIVLENSQENASISDITVEELVPVDIKSSLASQIMKTGGVQITGTITS